MLPVQMYNYGSKEREMDSSGSRCDAQSLQAPMKVPETRRAQMVAQDCLALLVVRRSTPGCGLGLRAAAVQVPLMPIYEPWPLQKTRRQ